MSASVARLRTKGRPKRKFVAMMGFLNVGAHLFLHRLLASDAIPIRLADVSSRLFFERFGGRIPVIVMHPRGNKTLTGSFG
jgi:hypothetical protein